MKRHPLDFMALCALVALALAAPPHSARSATGTLNWSITPTSGSFCSQPPPSAAANAGYTLQVLCLDMSQGNSSWLAYSGDCRNFTCSLTAPPYIMTNGGGLMATHGSAAAFFTNDPAAGQQVLDFHIDSSWINYAQNPGGNGGSYGPNINFAATWLNGGNIYLPINAYWEETFRTTSSLSGWPNPAGNFDVSFFLLRSSGTDSNTNFEIDFPEMQSSQGIACDLGMGSWTGGNPLVSGCVADQGHYHTLGTVVTSSNSTGTLFGAEYSDGANPITNSVTVTDAYQLTQHSLDIFWFDEKCGQIDGDYSCGPGPSPAWTADLLIKNVRIFTCPDWQTTGCLGP